MQTLSVPVNPEDHSIGPAGAAVTLVEYGSYDCPHCKQALAIMLALLKEGNAAGGPGLRLIYRHFPRETASSPSQRAAEAAEAAGRQGKFWEMHEHLLRYQNALDDASLLAYAALQRLDMPRFAADMEQRVFAADVRVDFESGLSSGVHSTPTFFINGIRHDDDWDHDTLLAAIRRARRV